MKRVLTGLWLLFIVFLAIFLTNYICNEKFIEDYNNGDFKENKVAFLGFTEPYIAPYNTGNSYYLQRDYETAIQYYDKALAKKPPKGKECDVRVNKALAMVAPFDKDFIENIKPEEIDPTIEELKKAIEVLVEEECATMDDTGHDEDATQLKKDIEELIKKLEQMKNSGGGDGQNGNGGGQQPPDPNQQPQNQQPQNQQPQDPQQDKLDQLNQIQNDSKQDRTQEMETDQYDYSGFDGDIW